MTSQKELQRVVDGLTDEQYRAMQFPYNRLPDHHTSSEIQADNDGYTDMTETYKAVEDKLLEYGIEIKIKSFQEFEDATLKLNKLYQDELSN